MKKCMAFFLLLCCLSLLPFGSFAEEVVLVDNEHVLCRVTGYGTDWMGNFTMKLYLENRTDKTVVFTIDNGCVDGYVDDPFWAAELTPQSRANKEVAWYDLTQMPTLIEFGFRAYDSNDWFADDFCKVNAILYPQGKENVRLRTYTPDADDVVLFDTADAMMAVTGYDASGFLGYTVYAHLENRTDNLLMFSVSGATLNGYSIDPFWATEVPAGRCADVDIMWFSSDLEENDIDEVEEIMLYMRVRDSNDWFTHDLINHGYRLTP